MPSISWARFGRTNSGYKPIPQSVPLQLKPFPTRDCQGKSNATGRRWGESPCRDRAASPRKPGLLSGPPATPKVPRSEELGVLSSSNADVSLLEKDEKIWELQQVCSSTLFRSDYSIKAESYGQGGGVASVSKMIVQAWGPEFCP